METPDSYDELPLLQNYQPAVNRVAFIGNYLPRKCGIATFTTDLAEAIANEFPDMNCFALAINDVEEGYAYLPRVRFELLEQDTISYHRAADYLNFNEVDVVSLQHEFGIFGGEAGGHILDLLRELRMPIVTTFHTVLNKPKPDQEEVMKEIARLSSRVVVMSQRGVRYLQEIYEVPESKIDFIHHGIPDVPFVDPSFYKDLFDVEGKFVILTFGLLSGNKGIENVIKALPKVVNRHPNVVYIVVGATHPSVIRHEGEVYRESLQKLARDLGVEDHVIFENRFVSLEELIEYIGATDIYVTPYLNREQITSGTLAYTVGAGKAVISTPYWYAEELLDEGRGVLVPFGDSDAVAEQVVRLIETESERHAMRKKAYLFGRDMIWPKVAQRYRESFERARREPIARPIRSFTAGRRAAKKDLMPSLNLYQMTRLTDSTGILQHAVLTLPNYKEGYTTDDNARALMVGVMLEQLGESWFTGATEMSERYLAFLWNAYNREQGRYRNFMDYSRTWLEEIGSEDSHGRAIYGTGMVCGRSNNDVLRTVATTLFSWALPATVGFSSPRSYAFTLMGISEYLRRYAGDRTAQTIGKDLGERLMQLYLTNKAEDWHWFEPYVTYGNGTLPQALLVTGEWLGRKQMIDVGLESLNWLVNIQKSAQGYFSPVGNNGFYHQGREKPNYDQQPIEAHAMVSACLEAYRITEDHYWYRQALRIFNWFLGANDLGLSLYDTNTGGCRDGLHPDRANQNQGAESTLAFLLSLLEIRLADLRVKGEPSTDSSIKILPVNSQMSARSG